MAEALSVAASIPGSDAPQHRVAAVLALHVLGAAHARDRLVLAAVRALRRRARSGAGSRRRRSGPAAGRAAATARRTPGSSGGRARPRSALLCPGRISQAAFDSFGHVNEGTRAAQTAFSAGRVAAQEIRRAHRLLSGRLDHVQPQARRPSGAASRRAPLLTSIPPPSGPSATARAARTPSRLPALQLEIGADVRRQGAHDPLELGALGAPDRDGAPRARSSRRRSRARRPARVNSRSSAREWSSARTTQLARELGEPCSTATRSRRPLPTATSSARATGPSRGRQ